jgi:hypothetical protein
MTITLDNDYNVQRSDTSIGYVGEMNIRTIIFEGYKIVGADFYKMRMEYPDGTAYEVDITSGKYVVDASVLKEPCVLKCQIFACYSDGENYILVKKSNIFDLTIKPSLISNPVPTYEQSVEALDKIMSFESNAQTYAEEAKQSAEAAQSVVSAVEEFSKTAEINANAAVESAKISEENKIATETAKNEAEASKLSASQSAENAKASEASSNNSAGQASESATSAQAAEKNTQEYANNAEISAGEAKDYAENSATSAQEAGESASSASESAGLAEASANSAKSAQEKAESAKSSAEEYLVVAQKSAENAAQSAAEASGYTEKFQETISAAEQHNGIFRGKDLTKIYTVDEIYSMVSDGKFDDLYLGDYFTVSIITTLPDETVKAENISLMIAGFNYYYNCGDTALTKPHAVLIPRNRGFATVAKMNETSTTAGGYINSYMHTTVLPCYASSLQVALNNHVLTYRDWLTNQVTNTAASMAGAGLTGAATGCEWADVTLQLMNEVQACGTTVYSSSAYDVGMGNRQLPVFKFINPCQYSRNYFWLRNITSNNRFGEFGNGNISTSGSAAEDYVRPMILFG